MEDSRDHALALRWINRGPSCSGHAPQDGDHQDQLGREIGALVMRARTANHQGHRRETGAEINIGDDGPVHIYAAKLARAWRALKEIISGMTREIEIEQTYQGHVVDEEFRRLSRFSGKDGLVHISELADFR